MRRCQKSGAQKLKASGRRAIMIAVTQEIYGELVTAAKLEGRTLSGYIRHHSIKAAQAGLLPLKKLAGRGA